QVTVYHLRPGQDRPAPLRDLSEDLGTAPGFQPVLLVSLTPGEPVRPGRDGQPVLNQPGHRYVRQRRVETFGGVDHLIEPIGGLAGDEPMCRPTADHPAAIQGPYRTWHPDPGNPQ